MRGCAALAGPRGTWASSGGGGGRHAQPPAPAHAAAALPPLPCSGVTHRRQVVTILLHCRQHLPHGALHQHLPHQAEALAPALQRFQRLDHQVVLRHLLLPLYRRARQLVPLLQEGLELLHHLLFSSGLRHPVGPGLTAAEGDCKGLRHTELAACCTPGRSPFCDGWTPPAGGQRSASDAYVNWCRHTVGRRFGRGSLRPCLKAENCPRLPAGQCWHAASKRIISTAGSLPHCHHHIPAFRHARVERVWK